MKIYIFPGQGSQYVGMGKQVLSEFPQLVEQASDLLGYCIKTLCLDDHKKQLNQTQFTQPALFVVSALSYLQQQRQETTSADYFAGHSLGEYNALFAAGALSFETGLQLVKKRGELMAQAQPGAMAAVLNIEASKLVEHFASSQLQGIDIANFNAPNQIVISGLADDIIQAQHGVEQLGGHFIKLNTSGAFHSRYMSQAQSEFANFIKGFDFTVPHTPVIANVTAKPYENENISNLLVEQITHPVKWTQSVQWLLAQGGTTFIELGPKKVLTKLVSNIKQHVCDTPSIPQTSQATTPQQQVTRWNNAYPIGTQVKVKGMTSQFKTRTHATLLFGHRPAIYLHNFSGYFHLDEISPV